MATIGKNQFFEIKNGDGSSFHNLVLRKSAVESVVMSLGDKISGDVYYKDNTLSVTMHEYITYNGVNYMLVNPPTIVKEGVVSDNSELKGMTKYSFVFYHPMCQLSNFPFTDVAVTSDETRYLSESKVFSWIGKPADFIAKMNKNLVGTVWIVELSSRFPQDKLNEISDVIPFDNATIADACKVFYDTWGVPYVVDKVVSTETSYAAGKRFKLVMGLPSNEIYANATAQQQNTPFVFHMGHGVGLKNNSRTPRNNKIITRISGYGSENNIPYGYPQVRWYGTAGQAFTYGDHAGVYNNVTIEGVHFDKIISYPIYKGILDGEYVELIKHPFTRTHLMPSVYRTTLFNKISFYDAAGEANTDYDPDITLVDYYDAIYSAQYPYPNTINLQAPSYESHEFEDEKPELGEAHIISATPLNNDLTPASSWDDSLDDEGNYKQSYFQMVLPQLSFDLYACASITEEMQINMRSGACLGCTFTVQVDWDDYKRNFYDEDGNFAPDGSQRDLTKYPKSDQGSIALVLQKDNSTFGTLMPNMYQYPKGETSVGAGDGDTFVILGISLPESYIFSAEWRLDADMKSYMLENNVHYFDYPLKFDEDFLFRNENILSQIRPNTVVRFNYAGQTQALFVKQITVKYGDQPLPQYDITLTDNVEVVLNQIGQVAEDVEKLSTLIAILRQSYGKNVWNELAKKLSKTQDDTAAGYITMLKGLQIGASFVPDILGEGGVLRMRDDGKVELVTDILYARMRAYFDSVVIREYRHESGNRIKSPAQGFNASRVEYIKVVSGAETIVDDASEADYFRCYWRVDDGEKKAENQFIIGDLAFCEHSDIVNGSLVTKRYWRVVTGRNAGNTTTADGEAWIDLSNAKDGSGNPVMTTITYEGQGGTTQTKSVLSFESGSGYPEAHDDICMLGCTTDTTRQGAIIEYVSGVDAPTYQIYQGLGADATNPYLLTNKNQITIGYDSSAGKAKMDVFGDAYIGARDRSTFIEYKQDDGTQQHAPVLNIKAVMQTLPSSTYEGKSASQFVQDNQIKYDSAIQNLTNITNDLQSQIDGQVETFFYNGTPSDSVLPESEWKAIDIAAGNNNERLKHLSDLYYDNQTGYAYRYSNSGTEASPVFFWNPISDSAVIKALTDAAAAYGLANTKAKTFTTASNTLPSPPYKTGDLWLNATGTWGSGDAAVTWNGDILKVKANINRASGDTPLISDWELAGNYLNEQDFLDWKAGQYATDLTNAANNYLNDAVANAIKSALGSALGASTLTDGGLMLTSLIYLRKLNAGGDPTQVSDYTTWGGVSGEYDANAVGGGIAAWYGGNPTDKESLTAQEIADGWDGTHHYRWARSLHRFDGSGYLADGNITWSAAGSMTIKNLTTIYGSQGGGVDVNTLSSLTGIFHTETYGTDPNTELLVKPQNAFSELFINRSGTAYTNYPTDKSICDYSVLNFGEMKSRFVTKDFFARLFQAFNGSTAVDVNDLTTTIDNIKAMVDFWSQGGITALGQGSGGGGGGTGDVTWALLASDQDTRQIAISHLNATSGVLDILTGYTTSGKNYAIQKDSSDHLFVNVPWENTTYTLVGLMGSSVIGGTTQPIYWNGSAFANTTYTLGKSVPSDAVFTDHYAWSDITGKPLTLTKNTTGFSISGGTTSKTLTVSETYTLGAACAKGVTDNSSATAVTSSDTNLITGRTLYYAGYVKSSGVTSVATGTGLTGGTITSTGTISINSTYQNYISHGESAYNSLSNYLLLTGGTITGQLNIYASSGRSTLKVTTPAAAPCDLWLGSGGVDRWSLTCRASDESYNLDIYSNAAGAANGGHVIVFNTDGRSHFYNTIHAALHLCVGSNLSTYDSGRAELDICSPNDIASELWYGVGGSRQWSMCCRGSNENYIYAFYSLRAGTYVATFDHSGNFVANGGVTALSDARHKQVIRETNLSVEQIANMPSVIFKWTDGKHDNNLHIGTLAQNWKSVLPELVLEAPDEEHTLSMSYGVTALVSAITTARKVVDHEARIKALEKENKELREELNKLKIA